MADRPKWQALGPAQVRLTGGLFGQRQAVNRRYVLSLQHANLLQNHLLEAGLYQARHQLDESAHGGWESPACQVRGHFLGHWMSACAKLWAGADDAEAKLRLDQVIRDLGRCQRSNGGEWVGAIPEKFLRWTAGDGVPRQGVWAPHYTMHKTLMGLLDAAVYAGSDEALDILVRAARWFHRWTGRFTRAQLDDILDVETGGMLEVWAGLAGLTGESSHLELLERYDRPRLFDRLLRGEDALTNQHANTTIPEAHGAARAWEVTGEARWRDIVEAYWACAVTHRGTYATGGQTSGEIWTPPFAYAARRGDKNQEHCTVYNLIRLADYLLRWTGEAVYADYLERNLYNGILAQQHPETGQITYFLPLEAGARKTWGSPTQQFWCCHGTLVQAHTAYGEWAWQSAVEGPVLSQYIPSRATWTSPGGESLVLELSTTSSAGASDDNAHPAGETHRPSWQWFELRVTGGTPQQATVQLRLPGWCAAPRLTLNGAPLAAGPPGSFQAIRRHWQPGDRLQIVLPQQLTTHAIPDEPGTLAFLDGPVLLAGLCDQERRLQGDPANLLVPDNTRQWGTWLSGWRVRGQATGLRFRPLCEVVDEPYTVYFPVVPEG
ncbi:MAG: glycoside hydrolase family 127 protein [Fimbriimonadaceae bacterium]|nr:glycoside hydrolase family 127 protein [Fimbriimonadaceae bacterium]